MTDAVDAGRVADADADVGAGETSGEPRAGDARPAAGVVTGHFGERLAGQRTALGLSQGDIAERLRLHPRQIAAIEAAELASLPALTFVRGYVRNYARVLGMDPEPLLADLRARAEPGAPEAVNKPQTAAAPTSSPATSEPYEAAARGPVSRQAVIAVVIAALVLFGIVGVFASRNPAAPAAPSPAPAVTPAPMSGAGESSSATAAAPEATPEPPSVVPSPPAPAAKAETKSADAKPAAAAGATLRLRFNEPSWVEVTQGDGRVLVSQVNEAGTEQRFAGQPPYRLVIGNASTVSVEWRGRVVDLKPATNFDNVARITLE